ncbi:hypothetical protein HK102_009608, partial [Quaeritorhiza haematococci]
MSLPSSWRMGNGTLGRRGSAASATGIILPYINTTASYSTSSLSTYTLEARKPSVDESIPDSGISGIFPGSSSSNIAKRKGSVHTVSSSFTTWSAPECSTPTPITTRDEEGFNPLGTIQRRLRSKKTTVETANSTTTTPTTTTAGASKQHREESNSNTNKPVLPSPIPSSSAWGTLTRR